MHGQQPGKNETETKPVMDSLTSPDDPLFGHELAKATAPNPVHAERPWRVALYSHDAMGLGHMRRNLLIAQTVARSCRASVLLLAGAQEAAAFPLPPGVDCLALPALQKQDCSYQTRRLGVGLSDLVALRAQTLAAALDAFAPDALVVDKAPRGALGELNPALARLRSRHRTPCILGLRDVLDDPAAACREWRDAANDDAIRRYYDAVWVYGDAAVYDPVQEYGFPADVAAKVSFTGYMDQRWRLLASSENRSGVHLTGLESFLATDRLVLCTVGGGEDGIRLAEAFAAAQLPAHTAAVLLTGPFMPPEARQRVCCLAAQNRRLRVIDFLTEPEHLLRRADAVVAMGGYNTLCDVLSFEKPALIVPRVHPRAEQLIRAQRLHELGLIDVLHPDAAAPAALSAWLARPHPKPSVHSRIDFHGLDRLPRLLAKLLEPRTARIADNGARTPQNGERDMFTCQTR